MNQKHIQFNFFDDIYSKYCKNPDENTYKKCPNTGHFFIFTKIVEKFEKNSFIMLTSDTTGAILKFVVRQGSLSKCSKMTEFVY